MRMACGERVGALGAEIVGLAAGLESVESGGKAVEGVFVFFAEFGGAFVEAGLAGFFHF